MQLKEAIPRELFRPSPRVGSRLGNVLEPVLAESLKLPFGISVSNHQYQIVSSCLLPQEGIVTRYQYSEGTGPLIAPLGFALSFGAGTLKGRSREWSGRSRRSCAKGEGAEVVAKGRPGLAPKGVVCAAARPVDAEPG